jgi:hypothetical protein
MQTQFYSIIQYRNTVLQLSLSAKNQILPDLIRYNSTKIKLTFFFDSTNFLTILF